jgi:hypothetical protein
MLAGGRDELSGRVEVVVESMSWRARVLREFDSRDRLSLSQTLLLKHLRDVRECNRSIEEQCSGEGLASNHDEDVWMWECVAERMTRAILAMLYISPATAIHQHSRVANAVFRDRHCIGGCPRSYPSRLSPHRSSGQTARRGNGTAEREVVVVNLSKVQRIGTGVVESERSVCHSSPRNPDRR